MTEGMVALSAQYETFTEAMVRAAKSFEPLLKQMRKHPRPGWKPRRRVLRKPPPWRRARLHR